MYRTILVPLDRSQQAESAVRVADAFARRIGAKVDLLVSSALGLDTEEHEQYLQKVAGNLSAPVGRLEVCTSDNVVESIVDSLRARPESLLCMSTHGRGGLGQAMMGSIAEAVVREAGVPVLMVGPDVPEALDAGLDAIQVCLDGSEPAGQLIPIAASWAKELSARLWLVEVQSPENRPAADQDIVESGYLAQVGERLRADGIDAEWDVLHDKSPDKALVGFREHQPVSLIMIATHGRTGLRRVAFGSVAMHVARHAKSPVLMYHPVSTD